MGEIVKIDYYYESDKEYKAYYLDDRDFWYVCEEDIELVENIIKKSDLKCGDIVIYRNGNKRIFNGEKIVYLNDFENLSFQLYDFNEDLTYKGLDIQYDIVSVFRPITEEIFVTKRETKEMSIAEIEEVLGHKVKIIKEEK